MTEQDIRGEIARLREMVVQESEPGLRALLQKQLDYERSKLLSVIGETQSNLRGPANRQSNI